MLCKLTVIEWVVYRETASRGPPLAYDRLPESRSFVSGSPAIYNDRLVLRGPALVLPQYLIHLVRCFDLRRSQLGLNGYEKIARGLAEC